MSKAEEIHYKAVIAADNQEPPKDYCISAHADHFNGFVEGFIDGYHQAEKDLELGWKDINTIIGLYNDLDDKILCNPERACKEILKQFKERKEK